MAERTGKRELVYSAWHRQESIRRYIPIVDAARLGMVDIDALEYEADNGNSPVALIETALDRGQMFKPAHATAKLAERAGIPAYVVLFTPSDRANPRSRFGEPDIERFRVAPALDQTSTTWEVMTPSEYAQFLVDLRSR